MNKVELKREINKLKNEYKTKCRNLRVKFAMEHNPVKVGDIVSHTSFPQKSIKVTEIIVPDYGDFATPECVYKGIIVGKDGILHPNLVEEFPQSYIDEINGDPYKIN